MDGYFLIYLLLLLTSCIVKIILSVWTSGSKELIPSVYNWEKNGADSFYISFRANMVFTTLNIAMTLFALFMLEKISKARWSESQMDSKESQETTQMDREVAAGWFDYMMVDTEFKFRNFTYNIPRETINSRRSSFLSCDTDQSYISIE